MGYELSQAKGSNAEIAIGEEATYGTADTTGYRLPLVSESLQTQINRFESNRIRSDRTVDAVVPGNLAPDGDIVCELQAHGLTTLVKHTLGGTVTYTADTPAAGVNQHEFVGSANLTPTGIGGTGTGKALSIEKRLTDIGLYILYVAARIDRLLIEVPQEGPVTATFGFVAAQVTKSATTQFTSAVNDITSDSGNNNLGTQPFTGFETSVYIPDSGSVLGLVRTARIEIQNGIATDNYILGQNYRVNALEGRRRITGTIELLLLDDTYYGKWLNSNSESLKLGFLKGTDGTASERSHEIILPNIRYVSDESAEPQITDEGPIAITLGFQALYDATETTDIKYTIVSDETQL